MKRVISLLAGLLWFCGINAQDVGVMHPYPETPGAETPAPRGYKPFYLSHFGRHGSRFLSNAKMVVPALQALTGAHDEGLLTEEGETLLARTRELYHASEGMWGQLSPLGVEEHKHIAGRMVRRCPSVFVDSVHVVASIFQRCILSMAASTGEIARLSPKTKWSYTTGKRYQSIVNTSHRPSDWIPGASAQRSFLERNLDVDSVLGRLFTKPGECLAAAGSPYSFLKCVYNVWSAREAAGLPPFDLAALIGVDAVKVLTESENLSHYHNMAIPNADSLIVDIISRADVALLAPKPSADLRYGHDNGLMRLFVQIGMEGYPEGLADDDAAKFSFAARMPMATNLQAVFYRNRKGHVLVKFLVNEKECRLGLLPGGPYYSWDTVKEHLSTCLSAEYIENNQ